MPMFEDDIPVDYASRSEITTIAPTDKERNFASEYQSGLDRPWYSSIGALAVGSGVDLVDTVVSSVSPVDRQTINNKFMNAIGNPGFQGWMEGNRGAVEIGSGIAGLVASDYIAGRILKPGSMAMQAIRSVPFAKNIATLDAQYEKASRLAKITQLEVARRGLTGVDRFVGGNLTLPRMGAAPLSVTRGEAVKGLYRAQAAKGLARNAATEAVMATTLNQNGFLYSDELSHNVAWGLAGLGIGGAIDSMVSTYALRRMANKAETRLLNAKAYDATGLETQRLNAMSTVDKILKDSGFEVQNGFLFKGSGATTDKVTSLAVQAAENLKTGGLTERVRTLFGKRNEIATPILGQAHDEMTKVTVRGLRGVSNSGFGPASENLFPAIRESLTRDPTSMYGIEEIGTTVGELGHEATIQLRSQHLNKRLSKVQELLGDGGNWTRRKNKDGTFTDELKPFDGDQLTALKNERDELLFANSSTPMVMLEPGEWAPMGHAQIADSYNPREVIREGGLGDKAIWSIKRDDGFKSRLGIGDDGELYLPDGKKSIDKLATTDMLHMYHVARTFVNHHAKTGFQFRLPKNASWFQLDMAEQLIKATDNPNSVLFPQGVTRETAAVESFAQKIDLLKSRERAATNTKKLGVNTRYDELELFKDKVFLNLPRIDSYTAGVMQTHESPIDMLLYGFKSGDDVRNLGHNELLKAINDSRTIKGFTDSTVPTVQDLHGNSFNFLMDRDGKAIKPIIGYRRPMNPYEWTRDDLFVRQALKQSQMRETLVGETADAYTREVVSRLMGDPSFAEARKIMELADDQQRSFVPGFRNAAPQTTAGSLMNSLTPRGRRDVDTSVMLAASHVQETKTRIVQTLAKDMFDRHMGDAITKITSTRNARSLMLANQFGTFRQGWQLKVKPNEVTLPDGTKGFQFVLDEESALNKQRFREQFNADLDKGQVLLNPDGTAIVLDELSMEVLARMQNVHGETLAAKNTALRSQGLPQIDRQNWYWPPPNLKGKYVGYTFDMQDNVVPGMTVVADSPEELTRMKDGLLGSTQWRDGYSFRTSDDVTSFMNLWDKAQMEFVAPNTTAIQPKKRNYGRTGGNQINENAFGEALVTMRDSVISHGDDLLDVLYDDVIKSAKSRAHIAKVESAVGTQKVTQHSSIYDRYLQNLTGKSSLTAKDSFFGDAYGWMENRINGLLKSPAARKPAEVAGVFKDWIRTAVPGQSPRGELFNKFSQELGPYMPYKSAQEMIERQTQSKLDPDVAGITSKLSWFEAASRLRWFESMHAVLNVGSIIANTPAVVRALQPKNGESLIEAAARNSSLTMAMTLKDGSGIVLPNSMKLLWESQRDLWRAPADAAGEGFEEFTKRAFKLGYMDQEVAEFQRAWGAIDSKAGWRGFMFGDAGRQADDLRGPFKSARAKVARSGGLDKWLSILSDKSEAMTRQWGMYAGRRVAQSVGITDIDAQLNFAHEITNKLIANYDPRNRPEIFQGALGAPIGLFQSYIYNFYNRMFRYVETGDTRSLATQYAMQAGMFGTGSVPGWNALNWAFFDHGQAKGDDPVESIYGRFGNSAGDLIMHGTLSNLPRLFGAEGASLYTRGDAAVRLPGTEWKTADLGFAQVPMPNLPVMDTLSRVGNGLSQIFSAFKADHDEVGLTHLAEIASNAITNRPIAGLIETFGANGFDTSGDGQVISESKTATEGLYRILGVRSMAQQKSIDQFYQNKSAQEQQEALKSTLRHMTRAAIRNKDFDSVPKLFADYLQAGGTPNYSRFLKDTFESALDSRSERALQKALKDPNNKSNALIARLLDGQVDIQEDEQATDDYGREDQIDELVAKGWETSAAPTGDPLGETMEPAVPQDDLEF